MNKYLEVIKVNSKNNSEKLVDRFNITTLSKEQIDKLYIKKQKTLIKSCFLRIIESNENLNSKAVKLPKTKKI